MALSIDDLRSFLLVAKERSVTRAAKQLGVSQQSVSERIRRLENRIGADLFSRQAHGMRPTSAGFRLLPYATRCVALIDEGLAVVSDDDLLRVDLQRDVSAAVTPYLESLADASHVQLSLSDDPDGMLDAIVSGHLDVAIGIFEDRVGAPLDGSGVGAPALERAVAATDAGAVEAGTGSVGTALDSGEPTSSESLVVEALFSDPVVWVAPSTHPLANRPGSIGMAELSSMQLDMSPVGGNGNGGSGAALEGLRVAARSAVAAEVAEGRLVELSVDQPGWVMPISIAYRATDGDRPAVVTLRNAITEGHARSLARKPPSRQPRSEGQSMAS